MISPTQIMGSLVYRTGEALNRNRTFMSGLSAYRYYENCVVDGVFNLWHYPGTYNEISNILLTIGEHPNGSLIKFPAMLNYQASRQERGAKSTIYHYNMAIAASTSGEWTTQERDTNVFEPLLRPVYNEFIRQVKQAEYLSLPYGTPPHNTYEVFTTGDSEGIVAKQYGEHVDALEIHDLALTVKADAACRWEDTIKLENEFFTHKSLNLLQNGN